MITQLFEMLKSNPVAALGWAIFIALSIALLAGHYVFNPFIFGSAYYVLFALVKSLRTRTPIDHDIMKFRLFYVSIIALLSLWTVLNNEVHEKQFVDHFIDTCYSRSYSQFTSTSRLCEEIQSHIDDYLSGPEIEATDR